jgi:fatty-acyl-CoA synthase
VAAAVRLTPEACRASGLADRTILADNLKSWCAAELTKFKVPRHVRFVDAFPMTASGKVQKFKLREQHETELGLGARG